MILKRWGKYFLSMCHKFKHALSFINKWSILSIFAICLISQNSVASDFQLFPFYSQLSLYIQDYHEHKNPQKALDYFFEIDIEKFEKDAQNADQPHSRAVLMAFFANILGENPELVFSFTDKLLKKSSGASAAFGTEVVAYGATKNRKKALALIVERYSIEREYSIRLEELDVLPYPNMTASNWQLLDIFWACYFATAKTLYIEKIAEPLAYWQAPDEKFKDKLHTFDKTNPAPGTKEREEWFGTITAQASMFGLAKNASKYPAIFESLVELAEKRQDRVGELTKMIIDVIKDRGTIPDAKN